MDIFGQGLRYRVWEFFSMLYFGHGLIYRVGAFKNWTKAIFHLHSGFFPDEVCVLLECCIWDIRQRVLFGTNVMYRVGAFKNWMKAILQLHFGLFSAWGLCSAWMLYWGHELRYRARDFFWCKRARAEFWQQDSTDQQESGWGLYLGGGFYFAWILGYRTGYRGCGVSRLSFENKIRPIKLGWGLFLGGSFYFIWMLGHRLEYRGYWGWVLTRRFGRKAAF